MTATGSILGHPLAGARRLLSWWSGELSELAAARAARAQPWRVMLLRGDEGCDIYLRTRERIEPVGTFGPAGDRQLAELRRRLGAHRLAPAQIVLRLQPSEVVEAHLSLPAAAGSMLEPILRNQIERLAPWPADKALFAWEARANGSGTLDVAVAVTARSLVEGLLAEVDKIGLVPGVVDFGTNAAAEPRLNLLAAPAEAGRRPGRRILASIGLLSGAALLAGGIGIAALVHRTGDLAALEERLEELRRQSAAALPSQASVRRQARLAAERQSQPAMAVMLEALSRALPDDAWLDRLEVEQGMVRMTGHAANAARLIGEIEASGHFTDVRFSAPTTLTQGESHESFTITARIVPGRRLK
jgi:general secretion pathway protein L